jgi:hypothetical protein
VLECGPVLVRYPLAALLFVVLPTSAVLANQRVADSVGRTLGREAAMACAQLPLRRAASVPPPSTPTESVATPELAEALAKPAEQKPGSARRGRKTKASEPAPERGIFVSAQRVLQLAERRVVPRGVPVAALGQRPGGLRLDGVAALGIGLRDGDILTHVLGAPATSVAAVVGAVIQARAQNVRTITGQFWREGRALPIAVEQPYLAAPESVQVSATP